MKDIHQKITLNPYHAGYVYVLHPPPIFYLSTCRISVVSIPGRVAQSVTCLTTDAHLTADPGVARFYTFVEMDHEIISHGHSPPFCWFVVSYKLKYVHKLLVNPLFNLAQEKLTPPPPPPPQ